LWWCFRVHGWRMFSPEFSGKVKRMGRDFPGALGKADESILRLLSCFRQWRGRRDDVQAAIEQAAKLGRVYPLRPEASTHRPPWPNTTGGG